MRGDEIGAVGRAVDSIREMVARKAAEQAEVKRVADEAAALERKRTMVELADGFERAVGGVIGMFSSSATELQATAGTMSGTAARWEFSDVRWAVTMMSARPCVFVAGCAPVCVGESPAAG